MARTLPGLALAIALLASVPGCGGPTTLTMYGHTVVYDGDENHPRMSYDGRPIEVRYDQGVYAFEAEGCDVGPGSTLALLAEQVAASPNECTPPTTPR